MTSAKQYLKRAYRLNELINSDLVELQSLKLLSTTISAIRYDTDKVQNGNVETSKVESVVLKIVDLERVIDEEINSFVDLKTAIRQAINAVENPNERLLLRLRYVEFLSWADIQKKMGFCKTQVQKIHGRALLNFRMPKAYLEKIKTQSDQKCS